ncbi:MAG: TIGR04282 family arsenosugar biosynthesis glycosyltransferase [bacterium]|nr:TIGR04282 family arsenosugar biosynthesis glycosyltransferase [bacterium]
MQQQLLIVFAKNIVLGKVKTRLAKTQGDSFAFNVYRRLVDITERESLRVNNTEVHVYFSDVIINSKWPNQEKFVQQGNDLGDRMKHAFEQGFAKGYKRIIGVGADLPDLSAEVMEEGLAALENNDTVFGPSEDGGYYLIGMREMIPQIFENKPWSTDALLEITQKELEELGFSTATLKTLNDVDTIEDLKASWLGAEFGV